MVNNPGLRSTFHKRLFSNGKQSWTQIHIPQKTPSNFSLGHDRPSNSLATLSLSQHFPAHSMLSKVQLEGLRGALSSPSMVWSSAWDVITFLHILRPIIARGEKDFLSLQRERHINRCKTYALAQVINASVATGLCGSMV